MSIKYKKVVATCVTIQIVLMWSYIVRRSEENVTGHFDQDIHFQSNKLSNDANRQAVQKKENRHEKSKHVARGNCIGLELPVHLVQNSSWSAVAGTVEAFVFSAYMVRLGDSIIMVGASTRPAAKLFCQYWQVSRDNSNIQFEEKRAQVRILPEHHNNK